MNQKIDKNGHEKIIKMYKDLIPINIISKKYGVKDCTIRKIAKQYDLPSQTTLFHTKNDKKIIDMYLNGCSSTFIANYFNVDSTTITSVLKKSNISIRNPSEFHRKYTLNENYFDVIDSQDKAYFIGLLYADGYNDGNGHISISLQERDINILNKFKKYINSNEPLNFRNFGKYSQTWSNQYRMFINSKHMSNVLSEYGMIPNKSTILEFPKWLDNHLYKDFLRGYWDGDGHIGKNYISVIGTTQFINAVQKLFFDLFSCELYIYDKGSNMKALHISRKGDFLTILNYLYKDAPVYLDRKYDSYMSLIT